MTTIFLAGLGSAAKFVLETLKSFQEISVIGALEISKSAKALEAAKEMGIQVYSSLEEVPDLKPEVVLNLTGDDSFSEQLKLKFPESEIFSRKGSKIVFELLDRISKDYELYRALYKNTIALLSQEKQHEVLNSIIREVLRVLKYPAGSIALYDPKSRSFSLVTSIGLSKNILSLQRWKARPGGLTSAIIKSTGEPVVIENIDETDLDINEVLRKEKIKFIAAIKLMAQDELLGILYVDDFVPRKMTEYEKKTLNLFAQIAGLALQKHRLIEQTRELALTDGLTGLNNHRYFHERISQELSRVKRCGKNLSLLMIDVDNFKKYNDANGHLVGDDALKRIASIIKANIRAGDIAVRYGGEEFVVILPEANKEQACAVAERIRKSVEEEAFLGEESLPSKSLTVSIGVSSYPEDSENKDELMKLADDALYVAKARGKNCIVCAGEEASLS